MQDIVLLAACTLTFVITRALILHVAVAGGVVDWSALALWFTACIILGSAIVAKQQVDSFRAAERNRHTIEQISKYQSLNINLTVGHYYTVSDLRMNALSVWRDFTTDRNKPSREFVERIGAVQNYFDECWALYRRNIIDQELFMDELGPMTLKSFIIFQPTLLKLGDDGIPPGFEPLAREAQRHYLRNRGTDPQLASYDFNRPVESGFYARVYHGQPKPATSSAAEPATPLLPLP